MKRSRITQWRQHLSRPRLTARIFPPRLSSLPPVLPQEEKTELVDLRDKAEQKKLIESAPLFTTVPRESWLATTLVCLAAAVLLFIFLLLL